jgi:hypothetical protein
VASNESLIVLRMDENVITILCMDEKRACRFSLGMVMFGNKGAFFVIVQKKKISLGKKPAFQCTVCVFIQQKFPTFAPKNRGRCLSRFFFFFFLI